MMDTVLFGLEAVAGTLVNGFLISLILIGLAAGLLKLVERHRAINASTRYGVWALTVVAVFAAHIMGANLLPSATDAIGPSTGVPWSPAVEATGPDAGAVEPEPAEIRPRADLNSGLSVERIAADRTIAAGVAARQDAPIAAELVPDTIPVRISGGLFLLSAFLILIWFSGATAGVASVVSAWRRVRALKAGARQIDPVRWRHLVPNTLRRSFTVAETEDVSSPVAAGLLSPMILIPVGLLDRLTTDEFRQVLLHEVAHLERFDDWTILAQRIAEALLWHHPGMRMVSREMQEAREIACDDWVVSLTRRPEAYVHSMGRMIELNLGTRSVGLAPGLAANRGDLMGRMRRLLHEKMPDSSRLSREQVAVAAGLAGLVLVLVAAFVPMMRLAFSLGDGEAMTYVFGQSSDEVEQADAVPAVAPLPRLASIPPLVPIPDLPELPPLPEYPPVAAVADSPQTAPNSARNTRRVAPRAAVADRAAVSELSVRSWVRILESAGGISSNGERMEVLYLAMTRLPDDDRVVKAWLGAVNRMTSAGARGELLVQFIGSTRLDSDRVDWIRGAAASIPSRGDRERILRALADQL